MGKSKFKFYIDHGRHLDLGAKPRKASWGRFWREVVFGVCYRVGSVVYRAVSGFTAKLGRDYRATKKNLEKRVMVARHAHFARSLIIFLVITFAGFGGLFAFGLLAKGLELKSALLNVGQRGGQALVAAKEGLESNDLSGAESKFLRAYHSFTSGREELERQNRFLTQLLGLLPQKKDSDKLFEAAASLSSAGADFTKAYGAIGELKVTQSGLVSTSSAAPDLAGIVGQMQKALVKVDNAMGLLDQVNSDSLPHGYREKLLALKGNFDSLRRAFHSFGDLLSLAADVTAGDKRVLLVLENNNELRPAGGFIGTFGDVKISNGAIKALNMSSIYDLDGQLREKIRPPFPVFAVNDKWYMRDSNWFISWPESARKISAFYEKEGGETPDMVVAMTPSLIQNLLKLTGPISLPRYGVTLSAENFVEVTQIQASVAYSQVDNKPKQILADLVPVLLERVGSLPKESWPSLLQALQDSLNQKQVALYSRDPEIQAQIAAFNWAGDIRQTDRDYLHINSANLNGTKTDLYVKQSVVLKSKIADDGSVTNELTLTRTNTMPNLPDTANSSFIRIVVPEGSQLVSNTGFDYNALSAPTAGDYKIDPSVAAWEKSIVKDLVSGTSIGKEAGKTFFGNWLTVRGGETKTVILVYKLPFKVARLDRFGLLLQKQIGSLPGNFDYELSFPSRRILWKNYDPKKTEAENLSYSFVFDKDAFLGQVLQAN